MLNELGLTADEPNAATPDISEDDFNKWKRFSETSRIARSQLFLHVASICEKAEYEVLRLLDDMIHTKKRRTIRDPLIPGLCLRLLGLYYRRIMQRYKGFGKGKISHVSM